MSDSTVVVPGEASESEEESVSEELLNDTGNSSHADSAESILSTFVVEDPTKKTTSMESTPHSVRDSTTFLEAFFNLRAGSQSSLMQQRLTISNRLWVKSVKDVESGIRRNVTHTMQRISRKLDSCQTVGVSGSNSIRSSMAHLRCASAVLHGIGQDYVKLARLK